MDWLERQLVAKIQQSKFRVSVYLLSSFFCIFLLLDYFLPFKVPEDFSPILLDRQQKLLSVKLNKAEQWRLPVTLQGVDPLLIKMLIAVEDKRFWYHPGVDPLALLRSATQFLKNGQIKSGGSTLTMQVVRLIHSRPRTILSKLIEIIRAVQLELHYSKKEILNLYLCLAPYGGNIQGIRAASLYYWNKEPLYLTPAETALLVSIPQSPNKLKPNVFPQNAKKKRDYILQIATQKGLIKSADLNIWKNVNLPTKPYLFPLLTPHLSSFFKNKSITQTTIDYKIQQEVLSLLQRTGQQLPVPQAISAVVADAQTKEIIAYIGSNFFADEKRYGYIDIVQAVRSPGSTLKPFIYGLAFDEGWLCPNTLLKDCPININGYRPSNFFQKFNGDITVTEALQQSLNIPVILILQKIGIGKFVSLLSQIGVICHFPKNIGVAASQNYNYLPLALGGVGLRLWDLLHLYTSLASHGKFAPLKLELDHEKLQSKSFLSPKTCHWITNILLKAPMPDNFSDINYGHYNQIAYKTGTSYGFRDAWCLGYNQRYVVGVWVGRADGASCSGNIGRITAAPILLKIFDILPRVTEKSIDTELSYHIVDMIAPSQKKFQQNNNLIITFPKNNTIFLIDPNSPVEFIVNGESPPFNWFVDGQFLGTSYKKSTRWYAKKIGFYQLTVQDGLGKTATAHIQVKDN